MAQGGSIIPDQSSSPSLNRDCVRLRDTMGARQILSLPSKTENKSETSIQYDNIYTRALKWLWWVSKQTSNKISWRQADGREGNAWKIHQEVTLEEESFG